MPFFGQITNKMPNIIKKYKNFSKIFWMIEKMLYLCTRNQVMAR